MTIFNGGGFLTGYNIAVLIIACFEDIKIKYDMQQQHILKSEL